MKDIKANSDIKWLVWLYFWLLIFEGSLRKWILPELSAPLLIVRDPIVLAVYYLALERGIFPKCGFTLSLLYLAPISFIISLFSIIVYSESNFLISLYGVHTNFLHLPLIFLIPKVFSLADVQKVGKWILLLAMPMAVLMIYQFSASPDDFINTTAGGEGTQIGSAFDKIRPPGTFSFITGIAEYYALVTAFLLYGFLEKGVYKSWLLFSAVLGLISALAVSGSRQTIGAVVVVLGFLFISLLLKPQLFARSYKIFFFAGIATAMLGFTTFLGEGLKVTATRIGAASEFEESEGGLAGRFLWGFIEPFTLIPSTPLLGHGLGLGTNVAANILTGESQFLLAEGEWSRIILESGSILGLLFIGWRVLLIAKMGRLCIGQVIANNILPWLILGACALNLASGQFWRTTTLGFAIFGGGLCLAACRTSEQTLKPI